VIRAPRLAAVIIAAIIVAMGAIQAAASCRTIPLRVGGKS
jgi:hypothetical protein